MRFLDVETGLTAFGVMPCYRAWAYWVARLDGGGYQVKHVVARRDMLTGEQIVTALCEVYSRAVFETSLSVHFEGIDSKADEEVITQIAIAFGELVAQDVITWTAKHGPLVQHASRDEGDDPIREVP